MRQHLLNTVNKPICQPDLSIHTAAPQKYRHHRHTQRKRPVSGTAVQIGFDASYHGMNHCAVHTKLSSGSAAFDGWRNKSLAAKPLDRLHPWRCHWWWNQTRPYSTHASSQANFHFKTMGLIECNGFLKIASYFKQHFSVRRNIYLKKLKITKWVQQQFISND